MQVMESYFTINTESSGLFKDRSSKFIAFAYPFNDLSELDQRILSLKKLHPKSRHFCYAYRFGPDGAVFRANDDGEPSGTAGRPILGQIDSNKLTNILIIVIRYFGGTKLGTSGLINAYKSSTLEAIRENVVVEKFLMAHYRLSFDYSKMSRVMEFVKKSEFNIQKQEFELNPFLLINIRKKGHEESAFKLQAAIAGKIPEVFDPVKDIQGFEMSLTKED